MTNTFIADYLRQQHKSGSPFEEYLKEIHAEDYHGTDDDMPDAFEGFVTDMDLAEVIEHADDFARLAFKYIDDEIKVEAARLSANPN